MTLDHGRTRYTRGCRCSVCKTAERDYQRNRYRRQRGLPVDQPQDAPLIACADDQGAARPVEAAVQAELHSMHAASERPGLWAIALALARILDDPRAVSSQVAAAKVLTALLDKIRRSAAGRCRGQLAAVRTMTANIYESGCEQLTAPLT